MTDLPGTMVPGYQPPDRQRRTFPLRNMEPYKTIPGFALVMLDPEDGNDFFTVDLKDEQAVFRGWQCTTLGATLADPAMFVVNGPTPIPPGRYGHCSQDWPLQVLHDGSGDRLPNGIPCGPVAGKWEVYSGRGPFTCQSHDPCRPLEGRSAGVHTVWISPGSQQARPTLGASGAATVGNGEIITATEAEVSVSSLVELRSDGSLRLYAEGYWWVSAAATLSSQTASDGSYLRHRVYLNGSATYLKGSRIHTITTGAGTLTDSNDDTITNPYFGGSPIYSAENVSYAGPLDVRFPSSSQGYATLDLRNTSGTTVIATDVILAVHQLGSQRSDPDGSLVYGT